VNTMRELLSSKRFKVAVGGLIVMFVSPFLNLPEEDIQMWVDQTLNIVLTLIAGYSATDFAKAMGKPAGLGHKDEAIEPIAPKDP
jgi:hypothetical protein